MNVQTRPDPVACARELGVEITAAGDEIERTRRIPETLLGRLHDSRLFRMLLPRSAGGDETEPRLRSKNSPGTTPRSRGTHSLPTVPP